MKDLLSTAVSSARPTVISFASGGKDKECDQDMEIDTMVGFQTAAGGAGAVGGNDRFVGFATPVVKRVNPAVAPQSSASFSSFSLTSASTSVCTPAPSSYSLKTHVQPPLHQQVLPASVGFTDFATPKPIALLNNVTSSSSSIPGTSGQLRPFQKPMPYTPIKTGSNGVGPLSSLSALKQPQRRISSTIIIPKTSTSNCNNIGLISNTESKEIMQTCNTFSYPSPIPSSTTTYSTNSPSGMFSTLGSSYSSSLLQTPAPVFGRRKPLLATSVGGSGSSTPSKFIPPKFKPKTPSGGGGIGGALMSSVSSTPSTSKHVSKGNMVI